MIRHGHSIGRYIFCKYERNERMHNLKNGNPYSAYSVWYKYNDIVNHIMEMLLAYRVWWWHAVTEFSIPIQVILISGNRWIGAGFH